MNPELADLMVKARESLADGRLVLEVKASNPAGRCAYLAVFHAAQAYIFAKTGRVAKTHNGVNALFSQLAKDDDKIPADLKRFVTQAYDLKAVADYEMGSDSKIPLDRSIAAVEKAGCFLDCIFSIIDSMSMANNG